MRIRCYSKRELAMMYFPNLTPHTATNKLVRWIAHCGEVTQHRHLLEVGAHCKPYNRCSIGICNEGGLDPKGKPKDTRTKEQREQLILLLMKLKKLFPNALIRGHSEMRGATRKACPCFNASAGFHWIQ